MLGLLLRLCKYTHSKRMILHGDDSRHIREDRDHQAMEEHAENVATIN